VFYAQLAREENSFDFESVAAGIVRKLLRRHPHVFPDGTLSSFGQAQELSPDQVVENWEAIKKIEREEKHEKLLASGAKPQREKLGILDDVPKSLPAMDRARKLQKRAAGVGFDWDDMRPVLGKLKEEIAELEEALAGGNQAEVEHELGDVLFATVNLARHTKIEAESALRGCNKRFEARFRFIENELAQRGESVDEKNLEDLDSLWEKAKQSGL
jgi:ATP diphosphatase